MATVPSLLVRNKISFVFFGIRSAVETILSFIDTILDSVETAVKCEIPLPQLLPVPCFFSRTRLKFCIRDSIKRRGIYERNDQSIHCFYSKCKQTVQPR